MKRKTANFILRMAAIAWAILLVALFDAILMGSISAFAALCLTPGALFVAAKLFGGSLRATKRRPHRTPPTKPRVTPVHKIAMATKPARQPVALPRTKTGRAA